MCLYLYDWMGLIMSVIMCGLWLKRIFKNCLHLLARAVLPDANTMVKKMLVIWFSLLNVQICYVHLHFNSWVNATYSFFPYNEIMQYILRWSASWSSYSMSGMVEKKKKITIKKIKDKHKMLNKDTYPTWCLHASENSQVFVLSHIIIKS